MMTAKMTWIALLITAAALPSANASAQDRIPADPDPTRLANAPDSETDFEVQLGIGALYGPAFLGSDVYHLQAGPDIEVRYKDRLFISLIDGIGFDLIKSDSIRAGPVVSFGQGRKEDGGGLFVIAGRRTDALIGLGDVENSVEVGGYVSYQTGGFSAKIEVRKALGGHEGITAEIGTRYTTGLMGMEFNEQPIRFSIGPRATIVDDKHNQAFFGIDPGQSVRSGLGQYDAGGGLQSYGLGVALQVPISRNLSAAVLGGYDRLAGDAANSPLVLERGSRNQATVGLGLIYRFGL